MPEPEHYNVNPLLVESHEGLTNVHIRAFHPELGLGTYDIACLTVGDFNRWLDDNHEMTKRTVKQLMVRLIEQQGATRQACSERDALKEKLVELMTELKLTEED